MWRIFKHYSVHTSYDGIPSSGVGAETAALDEIAVTGQLRLLALLEIINKREWKFAAHLKALNDLEIFKTLLKTVPISVDQVTPIKWKQHLRALEGFTILKRKARSCIKAFARYFAIMKSDGITARTIFNGKRLSASFHTPPTTNLPDIADVLQEISQSDYLVIGDWRHYFHQFRMKEAVAEYFGIEQGEDTFIWTVLPMGWSWSPRLAQSASMAILLEAATRAGLLDPKDYRNIPNPPSMIKMRGGVATVWYDNVIGMFTNAVSRDRFYEKLEELCSKDQLNATWKNLRKWNRKDMPESHDKKFDEAVTKEEKAKFELPSYLGLRLANASTVRKRSEDASAKMKWKHEPDRLSRWKDLTATESYQSLRQIARAVGCLLWDAVISLRPLCDETRALSTLSMAGKAVRNADWDAPISTSGISSDDIEFLRSRIDQIVSNNIFHTITKVPGSAVIECASDACGCGIDKKGDVVQAAGYGYVIWKEGAVDIAASQLQQELFPEKLSQAHIYILEMYAALQCIKRAASLNPNGTIRLAEDNTAVLSSLRNGFSHNHVANEMIQRVYRCLEQSGCRLEVIPVPSAANAADAPSRGAPYSWEVDELCRATIATYISGMGRVGEGTKMAPDFSGGLRHEEPDDNVWTIEQMSIDSLLE